MNLDEMGIEMSGRLGVALCDRNVVTEVSGDYTLPDYQPEIRRLLSVSPTVLPPAKYVSGTGVELNGTIDYLVLYVGADGGLYSVPLSSEYSMSVPLESVGEIDLNEGVTVFATTVSESVGTRVSAPRKLNLRCRLRTHVCAYGTMLIEERHDGTADPASICRRMADGRVMEVRGGTSELVNVSTEILGVSEDARVIRAEAKPFVSDVRASDGMVCASGEVMLGLTVGRENGELEQITRKLPYEAEIEVDGMRADCECRVSGTVSDLSVSVEEGRILCDVGLLFEARGMANRALRYTEDLYSTEVESVCEIDEYTLPVALGCENSNLSQSERISMEELHLPEGVELLDGWGTASFEGCEMVGEKVVLTGQSRYVLLCRKDGEYSCAELALPLRYETAGGEGSVESFDAIADVISCRVRSDGQTLSLDAELSVVADFVGRETIRPVVAVRFGERVARSGACMTVCYPSPEESAWAVAKRYHVSPDALTEKKGKANYYLI